MNILMLPNMGAESVVCTHIVIEMRRSDGCGVFVVVVDLV